MACFRPEQYGNAPVTGILPVKKEKTQSALNNFDEFTMLSASNLAPYIGFTEDEVEKLSKEYHQDFDKVKRWYDGYLLKDYQVYNPRAVVGVMLKGEFKSYWSETASYEAVTPLINMNYDGLKTAIIEMLSGANVKVDTATFKNDTVNIHSKDDVLTYMIHLGYLGYDQYTKTAFIPNEEIRQELTAAVESRSWNEMLMFQRESERLLDATLDMDGVMVGTQIEKIHNEYISVIQYHNENSLSGVLAIGLFLLTILPEVTADPFIGILIAVAIYAIGGGLLEVLISPIIEACPTDNKEKAMSLLHSFYCWGHVGVVLISTIFFSTFGIANWKILARIWAVIPVLNGIIFLTSPIYSLHEEGEKGLSIRELCSMKIFWVVMLMMTCAGASEQAVSQWASTFAEEGLKVSKTVGDLAGPMAFAVLMGLARLLYGKYGEKIDLKRFMIYSSILCVISYLCIAFVPVPMLSLIGCAVCGFSVGIMWPGTFSIASASIRGGGTAMFALLALAGDLGCSGGPTLAGFVSSSVGNNLRMGILAAIVFPVLLLIGIQICKKSQKN